MKGCNWVTCAQEIMSAWAVFTSQILSTFAPMQPSPRTATTPAKQPTKKEDLTKQKDHLTI